MIAHSNSNPITKLLVAVSAGESEALQQLMRAVYDDLHRMAERELAGEPTGHTLQPTALIHEAYFRLFDGRSIQWTDRRHFFSSAARAMRQILVDYARQRKSLKRGGAHSRIQLFDAPIQGKLNPLDLLALDEALRRFEQVAPRAARVVEILYFGGLSISECAKVLDISPRTVDYDWEFARAWLYQELTKGDNIDAQCLSDEK